MMVPFSYKAGEMLKLGKLPSGLGVEWERWESRNNGEEGPHVIFRPGGPRALFL